MFADALKVTRMVSEYRIGVFRRQDLVVLSCMISVYTA